MENVAAELDLLHQADNVAHLDVRLENTCFRTNGGVVLIDFDRYKEPNEAANLDMASRFLFFDLCSV